MAYRDPLTAARAQLAKARETVEALEERMTPRLMGELPGRLVAKLGVLAGRRDDEASTVEEVRDELALLGEYREALADALKRAPRLERKLNRQPRRFAKRQKPLHRYYFPDPHLRRSELLRERLHNAVREIDPDAKILDRAKKYFDETVDPFLVEACFHADGAPLRLHVMGASMSGSDAVARVIYSLLMPVRVSAPEIKMTTQALGDEILTAIGLVSDQRVGRRLIDDTYVIDAEADALERFMTDDVADALELMQKQHEPTLIVRDGLARLEWHALVASRETLAVGVATMHAIRQVPPVTLLARRKK